MFPIKNGSKQRDALSPLIVIFAVGYAIVRVLVNQNGSKFNSTHQILVHADGVNMLG